MGRDYARDRAAAPLGLHVRRADAVGDRIFIDGNDAAASARVYGGATVAAWYPITPSTSLAEAFGKHCARYRVDPVDRQEPLRHRPGRGRARLDRHGDRRGLERRPRLHRDLRAGHLADAGVHRPRLFRRDPGGDLRRPARRPVDRHADAHPAVRHPLRAYASHGDTKHVLLFPEDPSECFEFAARRLRPRRPAADAGLRHARPRHRHERVAVRAAAVGRRPALRPRQGDDLRGARGRARVRPLSRRRRRRHPLPHLSRARTRRRARSSPAAPRSDRYARYTEEGAVYVDNMQRLLRKFETAKPARARRRSATARRDGARIGVIYFGSTDAGDARGAARRWRRRPSISTRCACAPSRSTTRWPTSSHEHDQVFVVEQNRDAQLRTLLVNECGIDPARLVPDPALRRHADHRALHRARDRRAPGGAQGDAAPEDAAS